jgi:hypothetical protein
VNNELAQDIVLNRTADKKAPHLLPPKRIRALFFIHFTPPKSLVYNFKSFLLFFQYKVVMILKNLHKDAWRLGTCPRIQNKRELS